MATERVGGDGMQAAQPSDLALYDWWQVARRVKEQISADDLSIVAAGVAFYAFLAIFPMIGAVMTVFGLVADPTIVAAQMQPFQQVVPSEVYEILRQQVTDVAAAADSSLSIGLAVGLLLTLWSSTKGMKALVTALNVAYDEDERRGFIQLHIAVILFTLSAVVFIVLSLVLIAAIPLIVAFFEFGATLEAAILLIRWPIVAGLVIFALALIYRYGPNRRNARLQWITPGALLATALWLILSISFSLYVQNFGNYDETFGSLGAVVVLLFWFYFSALAVCIGAELNAELELQTLRDTTTGPPRPMGQRGAYVADHSIHDPSLT